MRYTILDDENRVPGTLDGTPLEDARELTVGEHSFVPAAAQSHLVLVWAGAVETGLLSDRVEWKSSPKSTPERAKKP